MVSGYLRFTIFALASSVLSVGCTQTNTAGKDSKPSVDHFAARRITTGSNIPQGPSYLNDNDQVANGAAMDETQRQSLNAGAGGGGGR